MMLKRNTNEKKKYFDFYYTELPALTEYLEKQESDGYHLKKLENNALIFEKSEPTKIRYCAEIFKGSSYKEFIESCTLEGWEHVATYNSELYIFRTQKSDVIDIMTDEKEKIKTVAKRVMLQPGIWTFFFLALYRIFHLILDMNDGIGTNLFEANVYNFETLMLIGLYLFITLIKFFDYFLWQYKIRNQGINSSFFNLKNTIVKRRIYAILSTLLLVTIYLVSSWIDPGSFDSFFDITINLILIYAIYLHLIIYIPNFDKKERLKNFLVTCIVISCFVGGALALKEYNEKSLVESSKTMLDLENIPISLTDLGIQAENCEDEGRVKGTRFAQLYHFNSRVEYYENDEYIYDSVYYDVLVSDYPDVRQKYINKILEEYDELDYEYVEVTPADTKWDCYYEIKNDYLTEGVAVKDNTVIHLRFAEENEKNFFDVAYEKLFTE